MNDSGTLIFVSHDAGLLQHWQSAFPSSQHRFLQQLPVLAAHTLPRNTTLWLDANLPQLPAWHSTFWVEPLQHSRIVCASSHPKDAQAIAALDAGCSAYCHAFTPAETLQQIQQVVTAGQIWVGRELMQQLVANANRVAQQRPATPDGWSTLLTTREREVALLAANGASNKTIASDCDITERTVKAHLAAIFEKLHLTDRLQLALRVHGIS
jgi:DNA-binding NarL/FixJ family response regulator